MHDRPNPAEPSETPYLFREKPLPAPVVDQSADIVGALYGLVVSLVFVWLGFHGKLHFVSNWLDREIPAAAHRIGIPLVAAYVSFLVVGTYYLTAAVHEVGHVGAGLLSGFVFRSMGIGPLHIYAPLRVGFGRSFRLGGYAQMEPAKPNIGKKEYTWMILGGPLANFASAAIFAPFASPDRPFVVLFVAFSIIVRGVFALLPFSTKEWRTDGLTLWMLFKHPGWWERKRALMSMSAAAPGGNIMLPFPPEEVSRAIGYVDRSQETVIAHWYAFKMARLERDEAKAAFCLETCLKYSGHATVGFRETLKADAAYYLLVATLKKPDLAALWLADVSLSPESAWTRFIVEMAILEARGDGEAMMKKIEDGEEWMRHVPLGADRESKLAKLRLWKLSAQVRLEEGKKRAESISESIVPA